MAKARRGTVEKAALIVGGLALAWLALNAGLAQVSRADADVIEVPGELVLPLDGDEQRVVYLRSGTDADSGYPLGGGSFRCGMVAEPLEGDEGTTVVPERIDETRALDGWNPHQGFLLFTAPEDGTYVLTCQAAGAGTTAGFTELLATGAELQVASPGAGWLGWVSPSTALVWSMLILFPAGVLFVVAGAFGARD